MGMLHVFPSFEEPQREGPEVQMRPLEETPGGHCASLKHHHFPASETLTNWVRPCVPSPSLTTKGARGRAAVGHGGLPCFGLICFDNLWQFFPHETI